MTTTRTNDNPGEHRPQWTVLGGGRLGRGVLAPLAEKLGMSSLIVVAGENTSRKTLEEYNDAGSYKIVLDEPPGPKLVTDYRFAMRSDVDVIVDAIADLRTRVVSTSVGEDRLPEVLPILAAGLRERIARNRSDTHATGLLLLVCENGRSPDGKPRAAFVRSVLKEMLEPHDLDEIAEVPVVVLDAIVPRPPEANLDIKVSRGGIWIEESALALEIFHKCSTVQLVSAEDIAVIHTRKLYCINTLHLLLSVTGSLAREERLDRIATDPNLGKHWSLIAESLATATCCPNDIAIEQDVAGISTVDYARTALKRLGEPPWPNFDSVDRAMIKLRRGWYLDDGRIDGPVTDAGLIEHPHEHPALVHAIALTLHSVVGSINGLAQRFACVPSDPSGPGEQQGLRSAFAPGLALGEESPFTDRSVNSPLVEALARDFQALDAMRPSIWTTKSLADFLSEPISTNLRTLPRRAGKIRCVMFDLDEGLVATESLLYRVTRELVKNSSHDESTLTHDDYVEHVGRPEQEFFERMTKAFQLKFEEGEDPVKLREDLFLTELEQADAQVLVKPGFHQLLGFLADKNVVMAVCSNGSERRVRATLKHSGISNYFAEVVTPGTECRPKGSTDGPSMYDVLCDRLKQKREDCVVVESSLFGVKAAVEAGLYTLLVVNDYTEPKRVARRGVQILGNSQMLWNWFKEHWVVA